MSQQTNKQTTGYFQPFPVSLCLHLADAFAQSDLQ